MYVALSSLTMSDLTSMRGGVSVAVVGRVYDAQQGYMDVVDLPEVLDVLITKVKELSDEHP